MGAGGIRRVCHSFPDLVPTLEENAAKALQELDGPIPVTLLEGQTVQIQDRA